MGAGVTVENEARRVAAPPISIIVPVRNGLHYTRAFYLSVCATNRTIPIQWVVVDSGSTDGTLEFCEEIGATVAWHRSDPFNYCAAVNQGARAASGEVWLIANNDLEFRSSGDLSRVLRLFSEWPTLAVLSPGRPQGNAELEFREDGINGATWAVRPAAYRSWGGLPEAMSGYGYDEAWTAVQCWRKGFNLGWLTGWDVLHHGSATFSAAAGNVSPALRRNLSRLLRVLSSEDLDRGWNADRILSRLYRREKARAAVRLCFLPRRAQSRRRRTLLATQGYAGVRIPGAAGPALRIDGACCVVSEEWEAFQWAPWLADLLLRAGEREVVGAPGCIAARGEWGEALWDAWRVHNWARLEDVALRAGKAALAPGPGPSPVLPALPVKRPTLRLGALRHAWRHRGRTLPAEW
ncbi:MAG: glycosyltransferase [SAR202 cluster bacterium]|nr:glycosyltransferase [SAR202 cluster bacterium]